MRVEDPRLNKAKKAVVALSGGVDSAHAAIFMKNLGLEVIGVHFKMFPERSPISRYLPLEKQKKNRKTVENISRELKIELMVVDVSERFEETVIQEFVQAYASGKTPNPCVLCNPAIKFEEILKVLKETGSQLAVTGHYSIVSRKGGRAVLLKAVDRRKDQSYFLYRLNRKVLERAFFPNGFFSKSEVIEKTAGSLRSVEFEKESQEVCFIKDDYRSFLKKVAPQTLKPGKIILKDGTVVGTHEGIAFYTVGQRKGLKIPLGKKYYVVEIDALRNLVVLGTEEDIRPLGILVSNLHFVEDLGSLNDISCKVKVRYRAKEVDSQVKVLEGGKAEVLFLEKCTAPAPGQSAVFYEGDKVLGGGIIEKWL